MVGYLSERLDQLREDRLSSTLARLDDLETQIDDVEKEVLIAPADPEDPFSVPVENPVARAQLDALSRQYSVVFEQFSNLRADSGRLVLTTLECAQPVAIEEAGLGAPCSRVGRAALGRPSNCSASNPTPASPRSNATAPAYPPVVPPDATNLCRTRTARCAASPSSSNATGTDAETVGARTVRITRPTRSPIRAGHGPSGFEEPAILEATNAL